MFRDENDNVAFYNYASGRDIFQYCERLMALHPDDDLIAESIERITSAADQVQLETDNWRVPISDVLRYHADLGKEVVTVGVLNKAVLWSRERWEEYQTSRREIPEVCRVQARIMRAAASGLKLPPAPLVHEKEDYGSTRTGTGGVFSLGFGDDRAPASSTRDGGRGPRILTLSQLGR